MTKEQRIDALATQIHRDALARGGEDTERGIDLARQAARAIVGANPWHELPTATRVAPVTRGVQEITDELCTTDPRFAERVAAGGYDAQCAYEEARTVARSIVSRGFTEKT